MRLIHFTLAVLVLSFSLQNGSCNLLKDIFSQTIHTTLGALESIPKLIPSLSEILTLGKNAVFGLPAELTLNAFNGICQAAVNTNKIAVTKKYTPNITDLSFILHTTRANVSIPITNPTQLWEHNEYNKNLPLVIFVTGWQTNLQEEPSQPQDTMANAYLCRGNVNFVTLNTAAYIDTLYEWSAFNTELIGKYVSQALQKLFQSSPPPPPTIHLIGHSLGAHICGTAGELFYEATGQMIHRITGLDPANPCFNSGSELSGLFRGVAQWVDVIHTDPGAFGKKEALGDVDFYPNGLYPLQPGSFDITSSHMRSWRYYAETVYPGNENNFLAKECTSLKGVEDGVCNGTSYPMGFATPFNLKGIFFLQTNSAPPYGKNAKKGYKPVCADTSKPV